MLAAGMGSMQNFERGDNSTDVVMEATMMTSGKIGRWAHAYKNKVRGR